MVYRIKVAGVERDLPLCPISDALNIGAFILFGDVELTERCAEELYKLAPEHDVMITAESKGIPLIHAMCRLSGKNRYVLARKSVKLYMKDVMKCETQSITTASSQVLYIDGADARARGERLRCREAARRCCCNNSADSCGYNAWRDRSCLRKAPTDRTSTREC